MALNTAGCDMIAGMSSVGEGLCDMLLCMTQRLSKPLGRWVKMCPLMLTLLIEKSTSMTPLKNRMKIDSQYCFPLHSCWGKAAMTGH